MEVIHHRPSTTQYKSLKSNSLKDLNNQALTNTFSLNDVDWNADLDFSKPWMPSLYINLAYLPSYKELSEEQKLRFNQKRALGICEQFIWFEDDLVKPILSTILAKQELEPELRLCLQHFIKDEERHSEMFHRLLHKAQPEIYQKAKYQFIERNSFQRRFFNLFTNYPLTFLAWIWLAIYFEERTLHISLEYKREGKNIDPTFSRVHRLHMIDEARHLQIDQYLLKNFYDTQSPWKRKMAAIMTNKVFQAYTNPKITDAKIIDQLINEKVGEAKALRKIKRELGQLKSSSSFMSTLFSEQAVGRTKGLLSKYSEMKPSLNTLSC